MFALPPVIEEMRLNRLEKVKELLEEVEGKSSLQSQVSWGEGGGRGGGRWGGGGGEVGFVGYFVMVLIF